MIRAPTLSPWLLRAALCSLLSLLLFLLSAVMGVTLYRRIRPRPGMEPGDEL